jgi:hypothetical protein
MPIKMKTACLVDIPIHIGHMARGLAYMFVVPNVLIRAMVRAKVDKSLQLSYVMQQSCISAR